MNDKSKPVDKSTPRAAEGNVDQIRDILFGGQMRDYERRFEELEERLKRDSERTRLEVGKRFESMEALLKEQSDRSQSHLKRLESEIKQGAEALQASHDKLQKAWREQSQESEEKSDAQLAALRERLHKLANETADSMRQTHDELSTMIDRVGASLRDDKVAREELAGFFSEVALRLTRQFELPKSKG